MTKTLVFKHYNNTHSIIKENLDFIMICIFFLFGLLVGAFSISICSSEAFYGLNDYFEYYIDFVKNQSFISLFANTFPILLLLIIINYILGLCIIGNFINIFILFLFSFGIGSVTGYLYRVFSLSGICFFSLIILPGLFLYCANYLISFKHSFSFSGTLLKLVKKDNEVFVNFKVYSIKFIIHIIFTVICCTISCFLITTFISLFDF